MAGAISFQGLAQKEVVLPTTPTKKATAAMAASYIEQAIETPKRTSRTRLGATVGDLLEHQQRQHVVCGSVMLDHCQRQLHEGEGIGHQRVVRPGVPNRLGQVQMAASNAGITQYNTGDFGRAGGFFDLSAEIASAFEATDTMALYNSALATKRPATWNWLWPATRRAQTSSTKCPTCSCSQQLVPHFRSRRPRPANTGRRPESLPT